jgi:hypothetical protein
MACGLRKCDGLLYREMVRRLVWDHLFGTYQAELPDVRIRYGLSHPRSSASNPFVIAYEELWRMLKEVFGARSWRERLRSVMGPPA